MTEPNDNSDDDHQTVLAHAIAANTDGFEDGEDLIESYDGAPSMEFLEKLAASLVPEYTPALGVDGNSETLQRTYGDVDLDDVGTGQIR